MLPVGCRRLLEHMARLAAKRGPMTIDEARAVAASEGLTLIPSERPSGSTGWKGFRV